MTFSLPEKRILFIITYEHTSALCDKIYSPVIKTLLCFELGIADVKQFANFFYSCLQLHIYVHQIKI